LKTFGVEPELFSPPAETGRKAEKEKIAAAGRPARTELDFVDARADQPVSPKTAAVGGAQPTKKGVRAQKQAFVGDKAEKAEDEERDVSMVKTRGRKKNTRAVSHAPSSLVKRRIAALEKSRRDRGRGGRFAPSDKARSAQRKARKPDAAPIDRRNVAKDAAETHVTLVVQVMVSKPAPTVH
jgi:hypothetical protein